MSFDPTKLPITIWRGNAWDGLRFTCTDSTGAASDFTNCTAYAHVRAQTSGVPTGTIVLNLSPTIASNVVTIPKVSAATTLGLTAGTYIWDMQVLHADGERRGPYIGGYFYVKTATTRNEA